jgi:hypothetical protein
MSLSQLLPYANGPDAQRAFMDVDEGDGPSLSYANSSASQIPVLQGAMPGLNPGGVPTASAWLATRQVAEGTPMALAMPAGPPPLFDPLQIQQLQHIQMIQMMQQQQQQQQQQHMPVRTQHASDVGAAPPSPGCPVPALMLADRATGLASLFPPSCSLIARLVSLPCSHPHAP